MIEEHIVPGGGQIGGHTTLDINRVTAEENGDQTAVIGNFLEGAVVISPVGQGVQALGVQGRVGEAAVAEGAGIGEEGA